MEELCVLMISHVHSRHNDLPWNLRKFLHNQLSKFPFHEDLRQLEPWSDSPWSHTDLHRLRQGMFWSAYVPCGSQYLDSVQLTLEQIDVIRRLVDKYPNHMKLVTTAEGIEEAHKSNRVASLIGVEGGHSLGSSLAVLRMFYQLGARYMTLTHTCNTPCDQRDEPLYLILVIREMNRLGMMVDLSHVSVQTMLDAVEVSKAPVIFSHSSALALCNSSRNVPDHVLTKLAINGGIVMVSFYNNFLSCSDTATLHDVIVLANSRETYDSPALKSTQVPYKYELDWVMSSRPPTTFTSGVTDVSSCVSWSEVAVVFVGADTQGDSSLIVCAGNNLP
uniref:Dipeptidase n=1 Tax=Timema bartmani TaxID=61472 RepID=A0A7R9EYU3_9NEOP|nr:unnamed protein product [Timema bartmani]